MKIRIGLSRASSSWDQLLHQEGVPGIPVDLRSQLPSDEYSAVIVTAPLDAAGRDAVESFLRHGGAVLGYSAFLEGVSGFTSRMQRVRFMEPSGDLFAGGPGLLDVDDMCAIPREAQYWRTDDRSPAVFAGQWGGGIVVGLPFDPAAIMADSRAVSRKFFARMERLPVERVSAAGKGGMRYLLHAALEYLHHARALAYAHLWYFPDGRKNLLAFRIDTDGAPLHDVETLRRIGERYAVPFTWCLDVGGHESWLGRFGEMKGDETAVHCYEHRPFRDSASQRADIVQAIAAMSRAGLSASGFTAPYGRWSHYLPDLLESMGFSWSSEFSYLYDALPWYPETEGKRSPVLQVPIHPICVGSLRKAGYTPEKMMTYFRSVISMKALVDEPLFFYHHPTHRHDEVIEDLLDCALRSGGAPVTMGAVAAWWKSRNALRPAIEVDGGVVTCRMAGGDGEKAAVHLRVSLPGHREALVPWQTAVRLDDPDLFSPRLPSSVPADLHRLREFDLRSALGELFTILQRRFR